MVQAVIFDFDGIIVDTEALHHAAFVQTVQGVGPGCSWADYQRVYIGFDDRDLFREYYKRSGVPCSDAQVQMLIDRKALLFAETAAKSALKPYSGVVNLLHSLNDADIPVALCSGALRSDIQPLLEAFELTSCFCVLSTAEDVAVSKPSPAPYLHALHELEAHCGRSLDAGCCWAVEDTPAGVTAAAGAGLRVLAVTNTHDQQMLQEANQIVDSLDEVSVSSLNTWLSA